jgi:hypothetical protein
LRQPREQPLQRDADENDEEEREPYRLQQDTGSSTALSCKFASQADCQKESKGKGTCIQNKGTTGSGMSTKTDKKQ